MEVFTEVFQARCERLVRRNKSSIEQSVSMLRLDEEEHIPMDDYQDDRDLGTRGDENTAKGGLDKMTGKVQEGWGKLTGDRQTEAEGKMKQAGGSVREGFGNAESGLDDKLDDVRDRDYDRDTSI